MPVNGRGDLKVTVGSTTLHLTVKRDAATGQALFRRFPAEPLNPVINNTGASGLTYGNHNPKEGITLSLDDFSGGIGAFLYTPGQYSMAENADTRWPGVVMPGPLEVVDHTGAPAYTEQVIKRIQHNGVSWIITTAKVYQDNAGTWTDKSGGVGWVAGNPTDIVSFKGVVAVAMGSGTAYQYSSDNGANWVTSTKTATGAKYANLFCVSQNNLTQQKLWYVTNPNSLFVTTDATNGDGVGTVSSTVGDTNNDEFNSIIQDYSGTLLMGKRNYLYTIDSVGNVRIVAGPYRYYATSDAGSGLGLKNFANPVVVENKIYYPYDDYSVLEYADGVITEHMEPGWFAPQALRAQHPVNCMVNVAGWLVVGMGPSATLKYRGYAPGGTYLLANALPTTTELYFGRYTDTPDGSRRWVWHGVVLVCSQLLRYAWYEDSSNYLYLCAGGTLSSGNAQRRAYVHPTNPLYILQSGSVALNTGTWQLETGIYYQNQPDVTKTLRKTRGKALIGSPNSLTIYYRTGEDYDGNSDYTFLTPFTTSAAAAAGSSFPASTTFNGVRFKFKCTGGPGGPSYTILWTWQVTHLFRPPVNDQVQFTVDAVNGQQVQSGGMGTMSMKQIRAFLDAWKDSSDPATLTEIETGDSWSMILDSWSEDGLGKSRVLTMIGHEVA